MTDDAWARAQQDFFAPPLPRTTPPPPPPVGVGAAPSAAGLFPPPPPPTAGSFAPTTAAPSELGIGAVVPIGRRLKFLEAVEVGLNLARSSWRVVRQAPELLLVTLATLVVAVFLGVGYTAILGGAPTLATGGRLAVAVKMFPVLAICGIVGSVAQGVIVAAVRDRMEGRPVSVSRGWAAAMSRLPALAGFGLIFAAERTVTNLLRGHRLTRMIARSLDYAWDFATYLSIPVIMFEPDVGAMKSVTRSAQLVRQRWGVQLSATGVISLAVFICTLPVLIVGVILTAQISPAAIVAFVFLVIVTETVVAATLQAICSAVMYRFVTTGVVGATFQERQLLRVLGARRSAGTPAYAF